MLIKLDEKPANQVYLLLFLPLIHWGEIGQLPERPPVDFEREGWLQMTAVVFLLVRDVGGIDQDVRLYFPIASMIVEANREQTWVH